MRHNLKEVALLLQSPLRRLQLSHKLSRRSWPALRRLASLYRRTVVRKTRIITVVGSFGKSTTMRAVTVALGREIHPRALFNALSGVARALLRIRPGDRHAVIEVGIGVPGQMARYARLIQPNITVVTSIGSEHRRSLKNLEVTRSEKAEMVRILLPSDYAILNGDDPNVLWMQNQTGARIITFGFDSSNDVRASDLTLDWPHGIRFTLHAYGETRMLRARLLGKHMAYPILAAVAVALVEGFTLDEIIPRLEALLPTPGRMEPISLGNGSMILCDDYKSGLETIHLALDTLSEIPAGRRIAILGEIEEPPPQQRMVYRKLGEQVGRVVSRAVCVGSSRVWSSFASGARHGGLPKECLVHIGCSPFKILEALGDLETGDVVLIKGRGSQRLDRITLALTGRNVRCDISYCDAPVRCGTCPMLEREPNGLK